MKIFYAHIIKSLDKVVIMKFSLEIKIYNRNQIRKKVMRSYNFNNFGLFLKSNLLL